MKNEHRHQEEGEEEQKSKDILAEAWLKPIRCCYGLIFLIC
ncbi:MAG TPA: hypothetical protein VE089_10865 [Nitrososphaeraceae archaeon]|nr:hypothetical protein [Nitrososphaeraceae archaeon]